MEPKLFKVLLALLKIKYFQGDILDAGANDGKTAEILSKIFYPQTVLAVEPLKNNIQHIRKYSLKHWNIQILPGVLSDVDGKDYYDERYDRKRSGLSLQMSFLKNYTGSVEFKKHKIDSIMMNRKLAFAHLDTEGSEHLVLMGANETILRDRPIIVFESHKNSMFSKYRKTSLSILKEYRYYVYEINEICGSPDCRNNLAVPEESNTIFQKVVEEKGLVRVPLV